MNPLIDKGSTAVNILENMQLAFAVYEVVMENEKVIDLRVLWLNQFYMDIVKRSKEECVGKLFSEIAPADAAWIPLYSDIALRKIGTQTIESYSEEGKVFFHVQAYSPEYGQVATILNIRSKFVQLEMEKEKDEQKIRSMINMMPEGILFGKLLYKNGKPTDIYCEYVNQSFEIYEGVMVNSLQGNNFFEVFPALPKDDLDFCDEAIIKGEPVTALKEGANGRIYELIIYPQGNNKLFVVKRDITQKEKAKRELEQLIERTEGMMNNLPGMVYQARWLEANSYYTFVSEGSETLMGLKPEELLGKSTDVLLGFIHPDDLEVNMRQRVSALKQRVPAELVSRMILKDGSERWFWERCRIVDVNYEKGHLIEGFITDITRQRELEAMELANSAKDKFLAHMSHEIRTPMNSIIGFSELAMDDDISPKTRDYFEKILSNSEWLLQIINDLLDISRIESGKMTLEDIPFDLHEVFSSCRTLILPKAIEKGITLYCYAEPSIGKRIYGDPTRLRQVLVNLLSNAVKFTNKGIIRMRADIKSTTEISVTMSFEVKDSGIGITPEQMKIIFDPFMQANSGTVREYGGSGLGLSITKSFVELMGGTLTVESTPGLGSKFSFEVTFRAEEAEEFPTKKVILNTIEKPTFRGEVLLCEDNSMNQQVIKEHLMRVGLTTVIAENGKIALELVKKRKFDLIFMDIHMPVMDGIEAADEIIKLGIKTPIVAMTANIMSSDMELYQRSGMKDCVGKPFTSQELWHCLMKYFKPVTWKKDNKNIDNELRQKLIENFVRTNSNMYYEISDALKADDVKLAFRLAHSLKTNAAQLNKILLQNTARDIEKSLKDGKNTVTLIQMESLKAELNAVLTEFAPLVNKDTPVSTETLNKEEALVILDAVESFLKEESVDCFNYIEKLRQISASQELIQQIENFQFKAALVALNEIRNNLV